MISFVQPHHAGGDSWPFSLIKKNECVAALYAHSHFNNLNVVFTAADDKPGIRTVMLYAHWPLVGNRDIGIYAGMTCASQSMILWYKINLQKVHVTTSLMETKQLLTILASTTSLSTTSNNWNMHNLEWSLKKNLPLKLLKGLLPFALEACLVSLL